MVLFGIPSKKVELDVAENMIFKNLTVLAVNGRKIFDTWYKTQWLLSSGAVDVRPLITRTLPFEEINSAMELLAAGRACKIVLRPDPPAPLPIREDSGDHDPDITGRVTHP